MNIEINGARVYFEIPIFGGIPVTATQVNSILVIIAIALICIWLTHDLKVRPTSKPISRKMPAASSSTPAVRPVCRRAS